MQSAQIIPNDTSSSATASAVRRRRLRLVRQPAFPLIRQREQRDCGVTCLAIIAKYYGKAVSLPPLRQVAEVRRNGATLLGLSKAAETLGFRTLAMKINVETFMDEAALPCIAHWRQNHFVVVYKITRRHVYASDPALGKVAYKRAEFVKNWANQDGHGIAFFLEPTAQFHDHDEPASEQRLGLSLLWGHLKRFKQLLVQLGIGALLVTIISLIFPFLTQSIVDYGISHQNIGFVYAILIAQLVLFLSRAAVELIRSWVLLHIGTRVNVAIISDFLAKTMRLPLSFFDHKRLGDFMQRILDHQRIEVFLTAHTLNIVFATLNIIVFGAVLLIYSRIIFLLFLGGSALTVLWIAAFLKRRRELDFHMFSQQAEDQEALVQLFNGMPEIKMNQCETVKRWEWQHIQARLFKLRIKGLAVEQYQQAGSLFFNELKNILITFVAAKQVIDGELTLGMMVAITYIIGQLNAPIEQFLRFAQTAQDARLGLNRLGEIHSLPEEKLEGVGAQMAPPPQADIRLEHVHFSYSAYDKQPVLQDLTLTIPFQQVTAIVGASGSGKTTLMKLILKFYEPLEGVISAGEVDLAYCAAETWRQRCGVVMQDGYLFNDTIARNIALSDTVVDSERLFHAAKVANLQDDIARLPHSYYTRIGADGHGLSQGQKQRILIARGPSTRIRTICFSMRRRHRSMPRMSGSFNKI